MAADAEAAKLEGARIRWPSRHGAAVRCVPFYLQVCRREEIMRGCSWAAAGSGGFRFVGAQAVRSVRVASGEGGRSKRQVWEREESGGCENARAGELMEAGCVINLATRARKVR